VKPDRIRQLKSRKYHSAELGFGTPGIAELRETDMARVKLNLPDSYEFSTEISVRIGDINYGGHLGNDAVLSLIHEARMRFFKAQGFPDEKHVAGAAIILSDAVIVYKSEGFHGDVLVIELARSDYNRHGFDIIYKITNKATGKEIARAKTGIVFFDYDRKKVIRIPETFRSS